MVDAIYAGGLRVEFVCQLRAQGATDMRSLRYLNTVLTVIAVLLTLQLWTTWSALPDTSVAQARSRVSTSHATGTFNSAAQRAETVKLLRQISKQNAALVDLFRSGKARVRVEGGSARDNKRTR